MEGRWRGGDGECSGGEGKSDGGGVGDSSSHKVSVQ